MDIEEAKKERDRLSGIISMAKAKEDNKKSLSLVGRCFVYRGNCYSCPEKPEDYWDVLYYVKSADDGWVETIQIQSPQEHSLELRYENSMMSHSIEALEEITLDEFKHQYRLAIIKATKTVDEI